MRTKLMLVGGSVATVGAAIAIGFAMHASAPKASDVFAQDLQKAAGLDLAQNQGGAKYALTETAPDSKKAAGTVVKRGAGTKAVRTATPTVKAAHDEIASPVVEDLPEMHVMQPAPAPAPVMAAVPVLERPTAHTMPAPDTDDGGILRGGSGRANGTEGGGDIGGGSGREPGTTGVPIWGTIGSIIRGGTVDGDNCDPRPGAGRPPMRTPVYSPNPGGMGTARMPTVQPSGPARTTTPGVIGTRRPGH